MRDPWLAAFAIYVLLITAQVSCRLTKDNVVCEVCNGYQLCGREGTSMPVCVNGLPCTTEQYYFCAEMITPLYDTRCDRPGIFPDREHPNKYYKCKFYNTSSELVKKEYMCPPDKTFHVSVLRCLSREEALMFNGMIRSDIIPLKHRNSNFACQRVGTFEDPEDCKTFHLCKVNFQSQDFSCPIGKYFNEKWNKCTKIMTRRCKHKLQSQLEAQVKEAQSNYKRLKQFMEKESLKSFPYIRSLIKVTAKLQPKITIGSSHNKHRSKHHNHHHHHHYRLRFPLSHHKKHRPKHKKISKGHLKLLGGRHHHKKHKSIRLMKRNEKMSKIKGILETVIRNYTLTTEHLLMKPKLLERIITKQVMISIKLNNVLVEKIVAKCDRERQVPGGAVLVVSIDCDCPSCPTAPTCPTIRTYLSETT